MEGPAYLKTGIRDQKQAWPPSKGSVDCRPNNFISLMEGKIHLLSKVQFADWQCALLPNELKKLNLPITALDSSVKNWKITGQLLRKIFLSVLEWKEGAGQAGGIAHISLQRYRKTNQTILRSRWIWEKFHTPIYTDGTESKLHYLGVGVHRCSTCEMLPLISSVFQQE